MRFVAAAAHGVLMFLAGCVVALATPDLSNECQFQGSESLCGTCVTSRCREAVNGCCGDKACEATLAILEGCANPGGGPACAQLLSTAAPTSSGANLQTCIRDRCAPSCQTVSGVSKTKCREETPDGRGCSCEISTTPNDLVCNAFLMPATKCCAPDTWPAIGQECKCVSLYCEATEIGCGCELRNYEPSASERRCAAGVGGRCCASASACSCGNFVACSPIETEVVECNIDAVTCPRRLVNVTSCSIRSP